MLNEICFSASLICYFASIVIFIAVKKTNKNKNIPLVNVLIVPTFISAFIMFVPIYINAYKSDSGTVLKTIFISFQNALQVFSLDGDYESMLSSVMPDNSVLDKIYFIFAAYIYASAPLLTVGVILTFFKNAYARFRFYLGNFKKAFIFSELNEKSILLAQSCIEKEKKKTAVVFTDVFENNAEESYELIRKAQQINAICLRDDISVLKLNKRLKKKKITYFIIGNDENENINQTLKVIQLYGNCENTALYSFVASNVNSMLISAAVRENLKMQVRRINEAQSLIYDFLYNNNILKNAAVAEDGTKNFNVVIVGMGKYATEFLKAIVWYCQLPGYRLNVDVFDFDSESEYKFESQCPELMKMNNCNIDGEARYSIKFHKTNGNKGIDVRTKTFDDEIVKLGNVSFAFIALGDDSLNIDTAIKLRRIFKKTVNDYEPVIETVVYDPNQGEMLRNRSIKDFRGNDFNIGIMGDLKTVCSYDTVINSELEKKSLERHLSWCEKSERFYSFEYYYRSSTASVIRSKIRKENNVPGSNKDPKLRTPEEELILQKAEHCGWNAYMRSEGYCYSDKKDDVAKTHYDLVSFDKLSENEKKKDSD